MSTTAPVIALDHPAALDAARVGRDASALATARAAGLPVTPGVVLTTDWESDDRATAAQVWRITSHDGARPLVVRPSATRRDRRRTAGEDGGVIEPVVTVADLDTLLTAVAATRADDPTTPVLVQAHVEGPWRGALFADDRAGSRRAAPLVTARRDGADVDWVAELHASGRVRDIMSAAAVIGPTPELLLRLSRVAARVAATFGEPQDLEWSADGAGRVQLLRIRPVLRLRAAPRTGAARPFDAACRAAQATRRHRAPSGRPLAPAGSADETAA